LQLFAVDHVQDRAALSADNGIATERVEVCSLSERGRDFRRRHNRAERATVSDSFGHRHDIGNHILGFESPIM
jgi:hypothetical protein